MNPDAREPSLQRCDLNGIRTLTLNRPERRNALDVGLTTSLIAALRAADSDPAVGAVVLAGAGPSFCAGADLGEFKAERADTHAEERRTDLYLELQLLFGELAVPVIGALNGHAVGLGASLAIMADLTVMADHAQLSYPEIRHGMVPSLVIGSLQRRTGYKQAFELLATCRAISAHEALSLGLVNTVVPQSEVVATATALAKALAGDAPSVARQTKRLFTEVAAMPEADALRAGREASRRRHGG